MKLHKNIYLLTWFNFLLDFRFYAPVAIIYFAQVSGSYVLGMSIFSITMLSSAIFEVPTGVFSDIIGRKKTLVLGAAASLISVTFYAIGGTYIFLAIGALLEGLARSFYSGNNDALLHDTLVETGQEEQYAHHYGTTSSMFQWALALAAIIGGVLASISFSLVMWLSVIPSIIALALTLQVAEPKVIKETGANIFAHLGKAISHFKQNYSLRMLSLSSAIGYASGESSYLFSSAFVQTLWPLWAIGFAKMLSNIGAAISFRFSGRIIRRFQALPSLIFGKLYSLIVCTFAYVFPTVVSPLLLSSTSVFYGLTSTAESTLLQQEYSQPQRSTMASLNSLLGSLLFAIAALALGLFADSLGPARALLVLRLLAALALYLVWRLFKKTKKKPRRVIKFSHGDA